MKTTLTILVFLLAAAGCNGPSSQPLGRPMVTTVHWQSWDVPVGRGDVAQTPHYRIFTTSDRAELRQYLPGFMEQARRHYLDLTGLPATNNVGLMDMYVMASRSEWADLTQHHFGPRRSEVYLQLEAGGYMTDGVCVLWDLRSLKSTMSVASHEGLHQFFHHRLQDRIPMWAEEGLCSTAEGFELHSDTVWFDPTNNPTRFTSLRQALVNDDWVPLAELLPMDAGDAVGQHRGRALGYYAQVWSLILFIRSEPAYRAGLQRMLQDSQNGTLIATAMSGAALSARGGRAYNRVVSTPVFQHYIADDLEAFESQWRRFSMALAKLSR